MTAEVVLFGQAVLKFYLLYSIIPTVSKWRAKCGRQGASDYSTYTNKVQQSTGFQPFIPLDSRYWTVTVPHIPHEGWCGMMELSPIVIMVRHCVYLYTYLESEGKLQKIMLSSLGRVAPDTFLSSSHHLMSGLIANVVSTPEQSKNLKVNTVYGSKDSVVSNTSRSLFTQNFLPCFLQERKHQTSLHVWKPDHFKLSVCSGQSGCQSQKSQSVCCGIYSSSVIVATDLSRFLQQRGKRSKSLKDAIPGAHFSAVRRKITALLISPHIRKVPCRFRSKYLQTFSTELVPTADPQYCAVRARTDFAMRYEQYGVQFFT